MKQSKTSLNNKKAKKFTKERSLYPFRDPDFFKPQSKSLEKDNNKDLLKWAQRSLTHCKDYTANLTSYENSYNFQMILNEVNNDLIHLYALYIEYYWLKDRWPNATIPDCHKELVNEDYIDFRERAKWTLLSFDDILVLLDKYDLSQKTSILFQPPFPTKLTKIIKSNIVPNEICLAGIMFVDIGQKTVFAWTQSLYTLCNYKKLGFIDDVVDCETMSISLNERCA